MKTVELTVMTIGTGVLYGCYVYYILEMGNDPSPSDLWYGIGRGIDEFFFNSGVKPKEQIEDAPNRIQQYLGNE